MKQLSDEKLEPLIIKGILTDKQYLTMLMNTFDADLFDDPNYKEIFSFTTNYYRKHKTLPTDYVLKDVVEDYEPITDKDFDVIEQRDFLITETNRYLKEKSVKKAIIESVEVIDKKDDYIKIKEKITDALSKDLLIDLGTDYWETYEDRLRRIFNEQENRVPLGFPVLDEFINGGLLPYTLSIILSRIHGNKSNFLINTLERLSKAGKNAIFFSMEMSEDEIAKRIDSISTLSDINKMYRSKKEIKVLHKKLKTNKQNYNGNIVIKEFPTGDASVSDFRNVLREYQYRSIKFDIIICDYLQIMKPEGKTQGELYQTGKKISEELRSLSKEFYAPILSVGQLNRLGIDIDFKEVSYTHVGESLGLSSTCDFMSIMGRNEDDMTYESELLYKIVKNRLGGRVNETGKFYVDKKSLKLYDESELDDFLNDATQTKDERELVKKC